MLRLISALVLFGLFSSPTTLPAPQREEVRYELVMRGKVIGELLAIRELKDGREIFRNLSDVQANLLKSFNVKFDQTAVFEDGQLVKAHSQTLVNGSLHSETIITSQGKGYLVNINGEKSQIHQKVSYSATMLMLREPQGLPHSFSEQDGTFHPLISRGNGRYLKENPKGSLNEYQYRDGKLVYAKVNAGWLSFEVRKQQS